MRTSATLIPAVLVVTVALSAPVAARFTALAASGVLSNEAPVATHAVNRSGGQQFPVLDKIANKVIAKYQGSSCEQLWIEKSTKANQPRSPQEQEAISMLQNDPQRREAFISKVAVPIANKMFECGLIP